MVRHTACYIVVRGWFQSKLHPNVDGYIFVGMVVDVDAGAGYQSSTNPAGPEVKSRINLR